MLTVSPPPAFVQSIPASRTAEAFCLIEDNHHSLPFILSECYAMSDDDVTSRVYFILRLGQVVYDVLPRDAHGKTLAGALDLLNAIDYSQLANLILAQWDRKAVEDFILEDRVQSEWQRQQQESDEGFDFESREFAVAGDRWDGLS